jgi:hypothetical protein
MAYNREWDQGKDSWLGAAAWHDGAGRGNVRQRDDDFHGEGKRRKFNNGVRPTKPSAACSLMRFCCFRVMTPLTGQCMKELRTAMVDRRIPARITQTMIGLNETSRNA